MRHHLTSVVLAAFVGAAVAWGLSLPSADYGERESPTALLEEQESVFNRVMRTGVLRCAYYPYAPALIKDPNTGAMSGIFYDVITEAARRLSIKVEWTEEVGYGVIPEGFKTRRYDAFCNTVWPTPERSRAASFSIPLYYSPVTVFVRADEQRFADNYENLDKPDVKFAVKDGDVSASYADGFFPNSKQSSIPQLADTAQLLDDVANGKADAVINEPGLLFQYLEKNPNSLKEMIPGHPLQTSGNTFMLPPDEPQLKMMFDTVLQDMLNTGFVEKTIRKYEKHLGTYYRVATPYRAPEVKNNRDDKADK